MRPPSDRYCPCGGHVLTEAPYILCSKITWVGWRVLCRALCTKDVNSHWIIRFLIDETFSLYMRNKTFTILLPLYIIRHIICYYYIVYIYILLSSKYGINNEIQVLNTNRKKSSLNIWFNNFIFIAYVIKVKHCITARLLRNLKTAHICLKHYNNHFYKLLMYTNDIAMLRGQYIGYILFVYIY